MGRRRVQRFHLHGGVLWPSDAQGHCRYRQFHTSGIDLTIDRSGIQIGGWYDSMVGIEGAQITWAWLDELRAAVMAPTPSEEVRWECKACGYRNRPRADGCTSCGRLAAESIGAYRRHALARRVARGGS